MNDLLLGYLLPAGLNLLIAGLLKLINNFYYDPEHEDFKTLALYCSFVPVVNWASVILFGTISAALIMASPALLMYWLLNHLPKVKTPNLKINNTKGKRVV